MAKAKFSSEYKRLCALLVQARESAGLRQIDVAERLTQPQSYVSKVELGERRLDVVEFLEFVRAIDADPIRIIRAVRKKQPSKGP